MPNFSRRWGLPSCRQEQSFLRRRGQRCGDSVPCRARLEGWILNVAARSPIWGDIDIEAFCRKTGYSREHATRELSKIRRQNSDLVFETKLRRKKKNSRKQWGVVVAERRKLRFDERSLFYDARGNRLHNHTTLGRDGKKIVPTITLFGPAPKPRGRPRKQPNCHAAAKSQRPQNDSAKNAGLCDNPYKKDSFGIQQKDLYGARRDVAQRRGGKERIGEKKSWSRLQRKAFAILKSLADCHWDNCKVSFARRTAYRYASEALLHGHDERRILSCYSDALFVSHGFAVDQAASTGAPVFFNLSSTVKKARQLLAKDGLTRDERVAHWYQNHPRNNSLSIVPEISHFEITRLREQIAASLGECMVIEESLS